MVRNRRLAAQTVSTKEVTPMKTTHTLSLSALLASALAALSGCASTVDPDTTPGTSSAELVVSRPGDLAPGIGASSCTSETCVSGSGNDCSDFDASCSAEAGCGVTTSGNPIAQVHTCVTIPAPPPSRSLRPSRLVLETAPEEEECFDAATCNQLIADCIGGDHLWTCDSYDSIGRCVRGECHGAP